MFLKQFFNVMGLGQDTLQLARGREVATYAVVFWSYTALMFVAEVNPLVIPLGYAVLLSTIFRKRPFPPSRSPFWIILNILVLFTLFYFMSPYRLTPTNLVRVLVYLTIYLEWYRLYHREKTRDFAQILVISFGQLLMVSVLTTSIWFAFVFIGYMILLTLALVALTARKDYDLFERVRAQTQLHRGMEEESDSTRPGDVRLPGGFLSRDFVGIMSSITVLTLVVIIVLFLFIPRFANEQVLTRFGGITSGGRTAGFGEDIDFRSVEQIQTDPTIVMRIQPAEKQLVLDRLSSVRVRGTAVDFFDGKSWRKSPRVVSLGEVYPSKRFNARGLPQPRDESVLVEQKIYLEPHASKYIFAFNYPSSFRFERDTYLREDVLSGSFQVLRSPEGPLLYEAESWIDEEQRLAYALELKKESAQGNANDFLPRNSTLRQQFAQLYLQLPQTLDIGRLRGLAEQVTRDAPTAYEKASSLERYFHENYAYTLTPDVRDTERQLEDFVFRSRAGHCEYFASAMAVMLRIIGIPARVVSGFYTNEWNRYEGYFIVREQNAHSWVEAWMGTWITFDPTPSQSLPALQQRESLLTHISHFLDSVKFKWYRYVIDYSRDDQMVLRRYLHTGYETFAKLFAPVQGVLDQLFKRGAEEPTTYLNTRMVALFLVSLGGLGIVVWLLLREEAKRRKKQGIKRLSRRSRVVVEFYERALQALRRLGFNRSPWQTPREFALLLERSGPLFAPLRRLTDLYYRVRYNHERLEQPDAQFVNDYTEQLSHLAHRKHHAKSSQNYLDRSTN